MTIHEIAEEVQISYGSCQNILTENLVHMTQLSICNFWLVWMCRNQWKFLKILEQMMNRCWLWPKNY